MINTTTQIQYIGFLFSTATSFSCLHQPFLMMADVDNQNT